MPRFKKFFSSMFSHVPLPATSQRPVHGCGPAAAPDNA